MSQTEKNKPGSQPSPMRRATDRVPPNKYMLTIKDVAKLLHQRSRISDEQYQMILERGDAQAARLNSHLKLGKVKKDL